MNDLTLYPPKAGIFLLLIYHGYFFYCLHLQFKSLTRGVKNILLIGMGGLMFFFLLPLMPLPTLMTRILQGCFWGLSSFSFLAFIANEVITRPGSRRQKALLKLPLLGLLMGLTFGREEGQLAAAFFILLSYLPLLLLLHHFKESYRPAYRSCLFFFLFLVLAQSLALSEGASTIQLFMAALLWPILSFYLFQVLNFFLVKRLVYERLVCASNDSVPSSGSGLPKALASIAILFFLSGCARFGTLNLQEHQYSVLPTRIVWLQVAGLQDEHLALLKFFRPTTREETAFEDTGCLGKTWSYNLYHLRPDPINGLFAQLTGKKNIKNTCADYFHTPIWRIMIDNGYQAGIFEAGYTPENFLDKALACEGGKDFLRGATLWEMRPLPPQPTKKAKKGPEKEKDKDKDKDKVRERGADKAEKSEKNDETVVQEGPDYFHVQDLGLFEPGKIYYDRSCQEQNCFTGLSRNIEYVFENFQKNRSQYFFLARDFTYFKALKDNDMERAKEILLEIEKVYRFFLNYQKNDRSMLLLVTSSAPLNFEFPEEGNAWAGFEEKGKPVLYKRTSLLAPVWAKGARAENFCGIYEEAEMVRRISRGPPKIGL